MKCQRSYEGIGKNENGFGGASRRNLLRFIAGCISLETRTPLQGDCFGIASALPTPCLAMTGFERKPGCHTSNLIEGTQQRSTECVIASEAHGCGKGEAIPNYNAQMMSIAAEAME